MHYLALKHAKYCRECHFSDILWSYACLFMSLCHIQFGSELCSCYIMTYCVLIWEWCYILPCILVLLSQIKYGSQSTIFLWHTQHWCLWSYVHLVISLCHIQFGSELCSCYIMTYCVLIWEWSFHVFLFCCCRSNMVLNVPFFFGIHTIGVACFAAAGTHHPAVVYRSIF